MVVSINSTPALLMSAVCDKTRWSIINVLATVGRCVARSKKVSVFGWHSHVRFVYCKIVGRQRPGGSTQFTQRENRKQSVRADTREESVQLNRSIQLLFRCWVFGSAYIQLT